ncbi:MAG: bifunctional glutamate N-acetyltransferase/amino-acid acetyltransferase ArgJ [Alphaproteobacteria bacterium]|nr:bifunctional glutamate N-acetyltransferase/amino-acid acetyltransferase ArgJ [Alphaproteobacteria bacterium]
MELARSPLAPAETQPLPPIAGVRLATTNSGIRYKGRDDLLLMELSDGSTVAGVLTRSLASSAPVDWCRAALKGGKVRAVLVNAGNANAFTGRAGMRAVETSVRAAAKALKAGATEIFVASTGVIGQPLDAGKIVDKLPGLIASLGGDAWDRAAAAIMTTDTFPKTATRTARIGSVAVRLNGIAKGSGMIAPDMATMLAFVATDAALPARVLRSLLSKATEQSFNCTTVDGDTSTSDTLILCATGAAKGQPRIASAGDPRLAGFKRALDDLTRDLAIQVVRDGEGAEKFVEIAVSGAASDKAAKTIALAIANSPLVKTAIAGEDANWGRIVMAVGKAGEKADRDRLKIAIGGVTVATRGAVAPGYDETPVAAHMKGREIAIAVDVGVGRGRATVWTCDLTHGYIRINGDYRS